MPRGTAFLPVRSPEVPCMLSNHHHDRETLLGADCSWPTRLRCQHSVDLCTVLRVLSPLSPPARTCCRILQPLPTSWGSVRVQEADVLPTHASAPVDTQCCRRVRWHAAVQEVCTDVQYPLSASSLDNSYVYSVDCLSVLYLRTESV